MRYTPDSVEEGSVETHVFQIGPDGTEYFAANPEEEVKAFYREIYGSEEHCEEDLREHFEEVTGIDLEFDFNDDGEMKRTTWRKLAEDCRAH
jgi:hypothetical protein